MSFFHSVTIMSTADRQCLWKSLSLKCGLCSSDWFYCSFMRAESTTECAALWCHDDGSAVDPDLSLFVLLSLSPLRDQLHQTGSGTASGQSPTPGHSCGRGPQAAGWSPPRALPAHQPPHHSSNRSLQEQEKQSVSPRVTIVSVVLVILTFPVPSEHVDEKQPSRVRDADYTLSSELFNRAQHKVTPVKHYFTLSSVSVDTWSNAGQTVLETGGPWLQNNFLLCISPIRCSQSCSKTGSEEAWQNKSSPNQRLCVCLVAFRPVKRPEPRPEPRDFSHMKESKKRKLL